MIKSLFSLVILIVQVAQYAFGFLFYYRNLYLGTDGSTRYNAIPNLGF